MHSSISHQTMIISFIGYLSNTSAFISLMQRNPPSLAFSSSATINPCLLPGNTSPTIILPSVTTPTLLQSSKNDNAIDVEFEQFQERNENTRTTTAEEQINYTNNNDDIDIPRSLLDASLQMGDPELSNIPFEFIDSEDVSGRYIECKIAFVIEKDGLTYSIGTPIESQVALLCEGDMSPQDATAEGGQMQYFLDPDEDANMELMEMAAAAFVDQYGQTVEAVFKRTPRTLTIQGDLSVITGDDWRTPGSMDPDWMQEGVSSGILEELGKTEDDVESDEYFDSFFKKELGENYRDEMLAPNSEIDRKAEEMMDLFNIPGLGTEQDDDEGVKEMLADLFNGRDLTKAVEMEENKEDEVVETGLRLLGFAGPDGKAYSLVQLIQPMILVAKDDPELGPDQRMLLTREEAKIIVPRLEYEFEKEFGGLKKD